MWLFTLFLLQKQQAKDDLSAVGDPLSRQKRVGDFVLMKTGADVNDNIHSIEATFYQLFPND